MLAVFDLDGTLIDSRLDVALSHIHAVRSVGGNPPNPEAIFPLIGLSLEETYERLLPPELHHRIPEAAANYKKYYFDNCMHHTKPFDGALKALKLLKEAGFKLAVATTKRTFMANRVLETAAPELLEMLDWVQGTDDFPHKPNPEILRRVVLALHYSGAREEIFMIGDTPRDIQTGKNFGCKTAAALYGYGATQDLLALNPDIAANTITELVKKILESIANTNSKATRGAL